MNKKGLFGTMLSEVFAYFLIGFILLLFLLMIYFTALQSDRDEILVVKEYLPSYSLLNYLRTPLQVDIDRDGTKEDILIKDLIIAWSYEKSDFDDPSHLGFILKQESEKIFNPVYGTCYSLRIGTEYKHTIGGYSYRAVESLEGYQNKFFHHALENARGEPILIIFNPSYYFYKYDTKRENLKETCGVSYRENE